MVYHMAGRAGDAGHKETCWMSISSESQPKEASSSTPLVALPPAAFVCARHALALVSQVGYT